MFLGVLLVMAACFCWGFIFVVPKFLLGFSPIEVSLGRYLFFGVISLILLLINKRHLLHRSYMSLWIKAAWFAFISTLVSYTAVVFCIRYANSAVAALIFGMSPITISLSGNLYKKEFPFKGFIIPGILMILGIALANFKAFNIESTSFFWYSIGLLCGFLGLAGWTWYTIANFHFMEKNRTFPSNDWITMMGVATLFLVIVSGVLFAWAIPDLSKYLVFTKELKCFLIGSFILGAFSSWVAFFFWNCANLRLPVSLAGQLTVFEMIFGILFVYIVEKRWPDPLEVAGISLSLVGLLAAFKILRKYSIQKRPES